MKTSLISYVVDYIFLRVIIAIIALVWSRYYIDSITLSLLFAASITALISVVIDFITFPKRRKKRKEIENALKAEGAINQFTFSGEEYTLAHIKHSLAKKHEVLRFEKFLLIDNGGSKTMLFCHFNGQKLTVGDLVPMVVAAKKHAVERLTVLCGSGYVPQASEQAARIEMKINLLNQAAVYDFLQKNEAMPKIDVRLKKAKGQKMRALCQLFLNKKRVKDYIFVAFILLLSSYFVIYSLYYIIFASFLLALALISYFFDKQTKLEEDKDVI